MEKQRWEESEKRRAEERRQEKRKSEKKEDACARKGCKVAKHIAFFQWFVAPEGRKVCSLKRRVRSHVARWEMKNCTPLWREAHFRVKIYEAHHSRTTFGSWDVEKVHAAVAQSTFPSQNVQNTPCWDHFSKLRCWKNAGIVAWSTFPSRNVQNTQGSEHFWMLTRRKSARCCGAKHISKSKCKNHHLFGPLLDVQMSFCLGGARDCAPCRQKPATRWGFCSSLNYNHHCAPLRYTTTTTTPTTTTTLHYTTLH